MPFSAQISHFMTKPIWFKLIGLGLTAVVLLIAWPIAIAAAYSHIVAKTMNKPVNRYSLITAMIIPALFMQFTWAKIFISGAATTTASSSANQLAQVTPTPSSQVQGATAAAKDKAKVLQAVSGDTLDVSRNGQSYQVHLLGLKAPLMADVAAKAQCFGPESQMFLDSLLRSRTIILEEDSEATQSDQGAQLWRYVTMEDGTDINQLMLEAGLARPDQDHDYSSVAQYKAYAQSAKAAKKGLWLNCDDDGKVKTATTPTPSPTLPATKITPTPTSVPVITPSPTPGLTN